MKVLKRLKTLLNNEKIEYVFFDFFDTLVHRNLKKEQINYYTAQAVCREFGISEQHVPDVYRMRTEAERFAEQVHGAAYTFEQVSDELYRRMCYTSMIRDTIPKSFCTSLIEIERNTEQQFLYADADMTAVLEYLCAQGIKIAIVSDYALDKQAIEAYLAHLGITYPFVEIFVSCDCHATKQAGDLYDVVLHRLHTTGRNCLMIGDNLESDVKRAQDKGLHALHAPWRDTCKQFKLPVNDDNGKQKPPRDMPRGMMAYAIALYTFCDKLYSALKQDGHSRVWFLSREGQALKAYFDLYLQKKQLCDVQTEYLYVSRLATYLPSLNPAPKEAFTLMHGKSAKSLLSNLQIVPETANQILSQLPDDLIIDVESVQLLWKNELFVKSYTDRYEQQRQAILAYLKQQGLLDGEARVAICDVGWAGTMQDHIQAILGQEITVYGYYLGMTGRTLQSAHSGQYKKGLLFDAYALDRTLYDSWSFDHTFFERLLTADHPAVTGYTVENGVASPVLREYESESGMYALVHGVQKQLEQPFAKLCDTFKAGQAGDYEPALSQSFLQGIAKLDTKALKLQRELLLRQYENFTIMKSGREYSGRRLTLRYAWTQRAKYLDPGILSDPRRLLIASRVLTNARLYGPAKLARARAAKLIKKGRA